MQNTDQNQPWTSAINPFLPRVDFSYFSLLQSAAHLSLFPVSFQTFLFLFLLQGSDFLSAQLSSLWFHFQLSLFPAGRLPPTLPSFFNRLNLFGYQFLREFFFFLVFCGLFLLQQFSKPDSFSGFVF